MITTVDIDQPPAEVYAYLTDPARFPEWQADVVEVTLHDPAGAGARFTTVRRIAGRRRSMTQLISEYAPPRRWAARAVSGPIRPAAGILVEDLGDGRRSRVTFTLDFTGHGAGVALLPLVRRQAGKTAPVSYRTAKRRLEQGGG
jgi:uncharacterized protein YndB with AHSA1/START domain